jgi:hypothetical protein
MGKRSALILGIFLSAGLVLSTLGAAVGVGGQVKDAEAATSLSQLAASMAPGTWAELQTVGLSEDLLQVGGYRSIFEYTDEGVWDPGSKQFLFIGQGHNADLKFISYSDSTNTWQEETRPAWWGGGIGHAYENNAIDPVNGNFYFHQSYSRKVHRFDISGNQWDQLPDLPNSTYIAHGTALEYFPEMGGLIRVLNGTVHFFNESTNQWSILADGLAMGPYHNVARYNPVHEVVLFGGGNGSTDLYRLSSDGQIQKVTSAPFSIAVASSILSVDPVSGDFLAVGGGSRIVSFDLTTGNWTDRGTAPFGVFNTISSPVNNYGVTVFITTVDGAYGGGDVYLYKHAASDPPTDPPPTEPPPEPTPTPLPPTEPPPDNVIRVGPGRQYTKPSQAAAVAQDGDVIEIDAGEYRGDVASWYANNLTIRGVGGMAHLIADGKNAEGKAIWVIKGSNTTVEYIEFSGATVPDQNGAGIRQEGNDLTVRYCYFHDNENGILGGGGSESDVLIEYSEFARNGYGDGYSHNMYISNVRSFTLRYSYSHHAKIGHNVKTRARENYILYNRLMDEANGTSSYVVDIPDAGTSYLIGNLIQQSPYTDNSTIVAYAAESTRNGNSDLYVINNTIGNDRSAGTFISVSGSTPAVVINNIFMGSGTVVRGPNNQTTNLVSNNPGLVDASNFDYRLVEGSAAINAGSDPGSANGFNLLPTNQYVHKASTEARTSVGTIDIGAYEYGTATSTFVDVPPDHWAHDYIEILYQEGYVAGCSTDPLMYCPEGVMTRAESAVFVERGVHGAEHMPVQPVEQIFADVPLNEWFAKWATALWSDGYTAGCGSDPLIYCPLQEHTRTEGCVFFLRMMHGVDYVPPDPVGLFEDVSLDWWGAKWVEAAYNAGLIPACETDPELKFCPNDPLDRAMGAYMMVQAKGLE